MPYVITQRCIGTKDASCVDVCPVDCIHPSMIGLDPPRHTRLRTLVSYAFTPRTVARLEPRIHSIVQTLLDQVQGQGTMDVINDVAHPLPSLVIAELLGVPPEDRDQFRSWSDAYLEFVTPAALQGVHDLTAYFTKLLEQRRQSPRDDLMSALLTASIDGEQLSQQDNGFKAGFPRPIVTRTTSRMPPSWISSERLIVIWALALAFTSAWEQRLHAWKLALP